MSRFEIKIVAALLVIAIIPLAASAVLVGQVVRVSNSFADGQTRRLAEPLERAAEAYRGLFEARKEAFSWQADLLGSDPQLREAAQREELEALTRRLTQLIEASRGLGQLELRGPDGRALASVDRSARFARGRYRSLELTRPLPGSQHQLQLVFYTPQAPFDDFRKLGSAQGSTSHLSKLRDELTTYYRVTFLILFGAVLLLATTLGIMISRRTTRRVTVLAAATVKVAEGDLDTRVQIGARDELGDLADAFNEMVRQLKESRERIGYLEKIGAWQEIARRLAHEIKNPLTPIQLAVQQLHRKYGGQDPAFSRLLQDAHEIVSEEISGLRRLVQDFSAFAKLPSVQPDPTDLNALIDDFLKSHQQELQQRAEIVWQPLAASCEVLADRMLIKHVLFNLALNAIEAAEEAGGPQRLTVQLVAVVDEPRGRAALTVSDNGPGMAQDIVERVFEPYYTTKEKGTGLGLAIVKKIVLEHRGTISVSSTPGHGSTFSVTLPLAAAVSETRPTGRLQRATARLQRRIGAGSRPR